MRMTRLIALIKKDLKHTVREPAMLFQILLFPLIVTVVFGLSFGAMDNVGTTTFSIGVVNMDSGSEHPEWAGYFIGNLTSLNGTVVSSYDSNATGQVDLLNGKLQALVVLPSGFGASCQSYWLAPADGSSWTNTTVELYVDSGSMIAGSAVPPMIQQVLLRTLYGEIATSLDLPLTIGRPASVIAGTVSAWEYMAPGMYAFASIFLVMTVAQTMTVERDTGLLKRMSTTPVTPSEFILSKTTSNMVLALGQVIIVFGASYAIGYRPDTDITGLAFAVLIAIVFALTCVGFGLITAVLSKSAEVATGLSFVFIMPMMFFGTFMQFGGLTQSIGTFMPSNYLTHALTTLFLRGAPVTTLSLWVDLFVVAVVSVLVLAAGVILFGRQIRK